MWSSRTEIDATLALADSQGVSATVMVEVKVRPVEARQVLSLMDQWQRLLLPRGKEVLGSDNLTFMVVAPFLGPSARERLAEAGISYADATGNIRFVTNQPAVFIETQGAVRNPWRENVRLRSLQGRAQRAGGARFPGLSPSFRHPRAGHPDRERPRFNLACGRPARPRRDHRTRSPQEGHRLG